MKNGAVSRSSVDCDEFGDFLLALDRREQQQEFVAGDARQHVGVAQVAPEPLRQLDQQRIADRMAVIVVDVLEIVDVEKGERKALAGATARAADCWRDVRSRAAMGRPVSSSK